MKKTGIAKIPQRKRYFVDGGENETDSTSAETNARNAQFDRDWDAGMAGMVSAPSMGDPNEGPQQTSAQRDAQFDREWNAGMQGINGGIASQGGASWGVDANGRVTGNIQDAAAALGVKPSAVSKAGVPDMPSYAGMLQKAVGWAQDKGLPGYARTAMEAAKDAEYTSMLHGNPTGNPFGAESTAATTAAPAAASAKPLYVWDGTKYIKNDDTTQQSRSDLRGMFAGAQPKPSSPDMPNPTTFAEGGSTGIAAGAPTQARFINGAGDGQSDSVPVKMDDGGEGRLADGEFVIDATTVAGLGNGSSKAGAKLLYDMVERIRTMAHGKNKLQNPVDPSKVLPA